MQRIRTWINSRAGYAIVFFLFGIFAGLNKETAVTLLGFYFFPVDSEYIFTYDKNFVCSKSDNEKIKTVCAAVSKINEEISKGELETENFGIFEKPFLEFIKGERPIKFYAAKNIEKFSSKEFGSGIKSYRDRLRFYLWDKSVKKSAAFSIIIADRIYFGKSFFKVARGDSHIMTHEILHLCWATEEEVRLLGY